MAKVTIVLSDDVGKDGPVAVGDFRVDYEGAPEGTPPTMAVLFGAAIQRLWRSRSLAPLVPLICADLLMLRRNHIPLDDVSGDASPEEGAEAVPEPEQTPA